MPLPSLTLQKKGTDFHSCFCAVVLRSSETLLIRATLCSSGAFATYSIDAVHALTLDHPHTLLEYSPTGERRIREQKLMVCFALNVLGVHTF